jgi:hypothetical protein
MKYLIIDGHRCLVHRAWQAIINLDEMFLTENPPDMHKALWGCLFSGSVKAGHDIWLLLKLRVTIVI